jgi:hypothetical protein
VGWRRFWVGSADNVVGEFGEDSIHSEEAPGLLFVGRSGRGIVGCRPRVCGCPVTAGRAGSAARGGGFPAGSACLMGSALRSPAGPQIAAGRRLPHNVQIRRPATRVPLTHVTQPLGMTTPQTPDTATLMLTPELVTARRIIASPGPVAHSRELGAGKQLQLPHATNYPGRHPRSHAYINDGLCQFLTGGTPTTTNWWHTMAQKGAITCRRSSA